MLETGINLSGGNFKCFLRYKKLSIATQTVVQRSIILSFNIDTCTNQFNYFWLNASVFLKVVADGHLISAEFCTVPYKDQWRSNSHF